MLSGGSASMLETTATCEIQTSRLPTQARRSLAYDTPRQSLGAKKAVKRPKMTH